MFFLHQMSSRALTGIDASHRHRCVMGDMTVRTDQMKWTVQV